MYTTVRFIWPFQSSSLLGLACVLTRTPSRILRNVPGVALVGSRV